MSFWPKYARVGCTSEESGKGRVLRLNDKRLTSIALKSFVTTVATPRKNVGRDAPSIWWPYPFTSMNVPFCASTSCEIPAGYISPTVGTNTAAGPRGPDGVGTERAWRSARSPGSVRGYVARSSWGANCAGLTKMERTVRSFSASERRTACVGRWGVAITYAGARTEREVAHMERAHRRDEPHGLLFVERSPPPFAVRGDGRKERN